MNIKNCIHKLGHTSRKVRLIFAVYLVIFLFISGAHAASNFIEINVSAASQVKPGGTLNIWVTVANLNVENTSINFDSVEFENPFSKVNQKEVEVDIVNEKIATVNKKETIPINRTLLPVAEAKREMEELKQEFFSIAKTGEYDLAMTENLNLSDMKIYADKEKQIKKKISQGVKTEIIDIAIPNNIPEGQAFSIPVKVLLSENGAEDIRTATMQSVDQMITFTVTSNPVPRRAVLIIVDGARADKLYEVAADNPQGNFSWMINNGVKFLNAVNAFPSITVVNHPSILTGTYPGKHGIASAGVFNKNTHEYIDYYSLIGNDINNDLQVHTIYENMNPMISRVFTEFVKRGATYNDMSINAGAAWEACKYYITPDIELCKVGDAYVIDEVIGDIDNTVIENRNFNLTVIWLAGNDFWSHRMGPDSTPEVLNNVDVQIGRLKDFYGQAIVDETIFVVTSDHGQTWVNSSRRIDSDQLANVLEANGYYKNTLGIKIEHDYYVGGDGGGSEEIYIQSNLILNDESSTDGTWSSQPRWEDIQPAAHAFYSQDYVDTVLVRYQDSNGYKVYKEYTDGTPYTLSIEDYFSGKSEYVDAVNRINKLDSQKSGDLILLANYAGGYFFDSKAFSGDHGNLNPEDSYVPLIISGPGIKHGTLTSARTVDIAPTIANLLGFSMPEADGIPLDIENHPPNTPSTPTGSTSGYTSTTYSYSASATDSDGDVIKYLFDWGDGTTSETAHYPSGSIASTSHSWSGSGTYNVKVKAIDGSGASSDWSNSLSVSIITGSSGGPDSFGYTFKDSNTIGGPVYEWIEISGTGTEVLPDSDDRVANNINIGFFFNYYGTDYSQLAIANNGLLFSSGTTWQYVNEPITQSPSVHGFIAPFWDDLVTYGDAGTIYYQTIGTAPHRMFIVEWYDNKHYWNSNSGITFEAILYEGSNNIKFQYKDVDFGNVYRAVSGDNPPYNNGGSSTVGIEAPSGDVGLQYSFNEPVITPGLAVLFRFPQYAGVNLYLSKQAPASKDRGSTMTYTLYYHNFADTPAQNVVLEDILPAEVEFVSASDGGGYDPTTRKVTWNIGSVAAGGNGHRTLTVRIPQSAAIGSVIQNNARISTSNIEVRYDDNEVHAETRITFLTLPPDVGVEPNNGGNTPSVVWHAPITFTYYSSCARGAEINIHINDGGPDITGTMVESSPGTWTYTTSFDRKGAAIVTYTVSGCTAIVFFTIYIDPAGYIYDLNTGARISGASVWLQRPDGAGGWENVSTGQSPPIAQPDANPLITGADGQYQWDVLGGSYRVHVEAQGYYPADSIVVSIPPPVTDLHVGLTRLPDTTPPSSVTNLNATRGSTWLNWTWNNPYDSDLDHIEVYLNSAFLTNISSPQNFHNITSLLPDTLYEIGTRTVDTSGNINGSWANATARTLPLDSTPPIITGTLSTAPNAEGWHNSSVTISWSVNDPETGIYSSSGCEPITLSDETPGTTLTCSSTNGAGLSSFQSVTARIDKTSPNISISNVTNGSYYNIDVTPVITISDTNLDAQSITLNGASYASGTVVSAEGSYTLVAYANDMAGNSMTKTVNFVIDKTAPEAAIRFNVISKDIKVYDSETGEEAGYAALPSKNKGDEKGWELRQYTLRDSADNTLLLVLNYKNGKKQAEISVISAQYNGGAVIEEVNNKILVRYVEGSSLKELEQKIEAKKLFVIEAKYKAGKGETEIRTHLEGRKEKKETRAGIVILELLTNNGGFIPRY